MLVSARYVRGLCFATAFSLCLLILISYRNTHYFSYITGSRSHPTKDSPPPKQPEVIVPQIHRPPLPEGQCIPDLEHIRREELGLSDEIKWSRKCIKPTWGNSERSTIQKLPGPLVKHKSRVNLTSCEHEAFPSCEELHLDVSLPYPKRKYPHLIFGVASKYDRIMNTLPTMAHWLQDSGAKLIGVVVDADDEGKHNVTELEQEYAKWGVDAKFTKPSMTKFIRNGPPRDGDEVKPVPVEHHHFMLIRDMLTHATDDTQWLGVLDDDTFLPSLYPMAEKLLMYDHTQPLWLGALSEDFSLVRTWGLMAFGGAGVFLSLPLAEELEPYLETCIAEARVQTGDGILRDCIYSKTHTKLTTVPHLYQHDMLGDLSGFFESGVEPLSLHHWKTWYREPVLEQAAITSVCGDCYLQRWQFGDDTLLANGYSITEYRDGLEELDLTRYEDTWNRAAHKLDGHEYDYTFGTLRPRLPAEKKKSYRLKDTTVTNTHLRQIYVYKGNAARNEPDEVIEFLWNFNSTSRVM